MRKIFLNQEKGIVMSIVPMAMVILLALAVAFFVATQNEMSKSMANTSGIMSLNVSNGGAERAIWYIQEQLDRNPNWRPQNGRCLFGADYDRLIKEKDPAKYENYGIYLMSSGKDKGKDKGKGGRGVGLYATKMVHEDDPTTRDDEWVLYSTGVMRVPSLLGLMSSFKKVEQERILIRIGTQEQEFPPHSIHANTIARTTNGLVFLYPDERGNSIIYSREGTIEVEDAYDLQRVGGHYRPLSIIDGYRGRFEYRTSSNNRPAELDRTARDNSNIRIQTNVPICPTPGVNLDFFRTIADYIFRNGEIRDSRGNQVVHGGRMETRREGNFRVYNMRGGIVLKRDPATPPNYDRNREPFISGEFPFTFHDINQDGRTVIYVEDGALRCESVIQIALNTRGVIVTRGRWVNTADFNDNFTNPTRGYYDENNRRNENIGMDLRCGIQNVDDNGVLWDYIRGSGWVGNPILKDLTYSQPIKTPEEIERLIGLDRRDVGTLDLFSEYDIFLGPNIKQLSDAGAVQDLHMMVWKGFIYSKGSIINYADITLKGAIMSGREYRIGGQGRLTQTVFRNFNNTAFGAAYNDGADLVLGYENINGTRDYFNNVFVGGQRGGTGRLQIIAWQRL